MPIPATYWLARNIVMLTTNYASGPRATHSPGQARISRYAWGNADYHDVIHGRLKQLIRWLTEVCPGSANRGVVDTAPLMERQYAQLAGLGWQGKNTLLLNRAGGSLFFLAALLTDVDLATDRPHETDHCGSCTACLDACPTQAFPEPYLLDARRCISYLTIELRDEIPEPFRHHLDDWLFGCDVCQDVCPWNRQVPVTSTAEFASLPGNDPIELCELLRMDDQAFRARFRKTPLWRAKRAGILRNAALLLGAQRYLPATACLTYGLEDVAEVVRTACAWALGEFATPAARQAVATRLAGERDVRVRESLQAALTRAAGQQGPPTA